MTYRELLEKLKALSPEQLDHDGEEVGLKEGQVLLDLEQ